MLPRNSPKRVIDHYSLQKELITKIATCPNCRSFDVFISQLELVCKACGSHFGFFDVYEDPKIRKDMIPQESANGTDFGPEILSDPIFQQQCTNWGYAIIQIGDRLVRVYCKPPDKRVLGDETPGQQPNAYVGIQPGTDPRVEMATQDNLERDRNTTKAILRILYSKGLNPNQPRDDKGQWASTGGTTISEHKKKFPAGMPGIPQAKPYWDFPVRQGEGYGKPYETYKGVPIYCKEGLSDTDKVQFTQAVKVGMDHMPDKIDHLVTRVKITDEAGPSFQAGGATMEEAAHFDAYGTGEVVIRTTVTPDYVEHGLLQHEFAHAVWRDTETRYDNFNEKWNAYENHIVVDMRQKGYPWFGNPSEMKEGDSVGEPGLVFHPEKWQRDEAYGDKSINSYLTQDIAQERAMAGGRHGFADFRHFAEASGSEGGVTTYAKRQLKEGHVTENFAEMTALNLDESYSSRKAGSTDKPALDFPKSYKSWRAIMLRYGWKEPK